MLKTYNLYKERISLSSKNNRFPMMNVMRIETFCVILFCKKIAKYHVMAWGDVPFLSVITVISGQIPTRAGIPMKPKPRFTYRNFDPLL